MLRNSISYFKYAMFDIKFISYTELNDCGIPFHLGGVTHVFARFTKKQFIPGNIDLACFFFPFPFSFRHVHFSSPFASLLFFSLFVSLFFNSLLRCLNAPSSFFASRILKWISTKIARGHINLNINISGFITK